MISEEAIFAQIDRMRKHSLGFTIHYLRSVFDLTEIEAMEYIVLWILKESTVNKSQLARLMLEYEQKRDELDGIAEAIEQAVLEIGETVVTGNVTAKYSGPYLRKDYEAAYDDHYMEAKEAEDEQTLGAFEATRAAHTKTREYVSWAKVCKDLEIDVTEGKTIPARVSIKIDRE
jgi:hypothetical protein